jgi:trehalose 6-phosphate phosphatase
MKLPQGLDRVASHPDTAALACDYDGTIAPIVDDPDAALPLPAALEALAAIVNAGVDVAIISGRPVSFLRDRVPVAGCALIGQYGLESLHGDVVVVDPRAEPFVDAVHRAAGDAAAAWPELRVEHKGDLAFTVHWRTAPDHAPAPDALEELATRHGLAVQPGRQACELRTPVPMDKGIALNRWLVTRGRPVAAFVGDDLGDLEAFDALEQWYTHGEDRAAVRIAVRSDEVPPALLERADVVVDGPEGVAALLSSLTRRP